MAILELISQHRCHNGWQRYYRHDSQETGLPMRFSVFVPEQAEHGRVPALFFLAGLTCTEETFMIKGGVQRLAAQAGLMLICPDTSPRDTGIPGEANDWDLGVGAGFYVDATASPWKDHYRMYSYVVDELYTIATQDLPADPARLGIFGHSMGGHGALVLGLRNPDKFRTLSAFAPIAEPSRSPWGKKAFEAYLGADEKAWLAYDAAQLMRGLTKPFPYGILIDQGLADAFLTEQLHPEAFEAACRHADQPLTLRRHEGYDHSYYFISTFIEDHIRFHMARLA